VETWLDFDDFQGIVEQMYTGYVRQGCKAEDARYALTNATFTKINVSFNYEGMKNFFNKRLCFRCQPEMRRMAELMLHEVTDAFPYFGGVFMCKCNEAGYCVEEKCCGKFPTKEEVLSVYRNYDKARPTAEAVRNCK
jgi:thymidylate synthase ThyX